MLIIYDMHLPRGIQVSRYPVPTNVQELRKYLRVTKYFRKFDVQYSMIPGLLTSLACKGALVSPGA